MNINQVKKVAYPKEHGSWGFVLEPLILSIIIAYSNDGLYLLVASFFIFLSHQPVRILLSNTQSQQLKKIAILFLLFYLMVILFFILKISFNHALYIYFPFLLAITLMITYLGLELLNFTRVLVIEAIAPLAINLIAITIVFFNDWSVAASLAFLVVLLNRSFPTVLYIHERLKLEKDKKVSSVHVNLFGILGLLLTIFLSFQGLVPFLSILAVFILVVRSILGLSNARKRINVKQLGISEFIYGILFVLINAVGYIMNI